MDIYNSDPEQQAKDDALEAKAESFFEQIRKVQQADAVRSEKIAGRVSKVKK